MENKYYIPSIEEFHVGFEYERLVSMKGGTAVSIEEHHETWEKRIATRQEIALIFTSFPNIIRVKYLDQEDIESLSEAATKDTYDIYAQINDAFYIDYNLLTKECKIHSMDDVLFFGKIKNKSVLKQVLKMIGVE